MLAARGSPGPHTPPGAHEPAAYGSCMRYAHEPTCLAVAILWAVTAVDDIPAGVDGEVTTDGARLRVEGVGSTDQLAS